MQTIQLLKGLTISYDNLEKEKLEEIANFIQKYSFLFTDFENENNHITIPIDEFYPLVEKIVKKFTDDNNLKQNVESQDFLPAMYLSYLILKSDRQGNTLVQLPSNLTMELLLFLLSIKYYHYDVSKICETLFSNSSIQYEEMIEQLKKEQRLNTYNYYLKCASNFLEACDTSMLDNLESIIQKLTQENFEYIKTVQTQQSRLTDLKQLSKDEFDTLFQSFLKYINAPKEWLNYYEHLKKNNSIQFQYSTTQDNGTCYFDSSNQTWKIELISDKTIRTFITFAHEFAHYVSLTQNPDFNFSLLEFPSIYFENIASEFLEENGYEKGIINEILNARRANNFALFGTQILQLKDILSYKKNGPITLEDKIEFYKNSIQAQNDFILNMRKILKDEGIKELPDFLQTLEEREPIEIINQELDQKINGIVQSGLLILNGYQYLVGSLLSFEILDTENRKTTTQKMIDITNQLSDYSITSILKLFNINLQVTPIPTAKNETQKKLSLSLNDKKDNSFKS